MSKVLLLLHHQISELIISGLLSRIPDVQLAKVSNRLAAKYSLTDTITHIQKELCTSGLQKEDVDLVIVEANYGNPASEKINTELIDYILTQFEVAVIIAYSGTTAALANALKYNKRLMVMDKNNKFEEDLINICSLLQQDNTNQAIAPRIFTTRSLKEFLGQQTIPATRQRSATLPEVSPMQEGKVFRERSNTFSSMTPMYTLTKMAVDENNDNDNVNQEQSSNDNNSFVTKMEC